MRGDSQLSHTARQAIETSTDPIDVSLASAWELGIKLSLGKYVLNVPLNEFFRRSIAGQDFTWLEIRPQHVMHVARLPFHHRDPFDRMLIAQSLSESFTLVTKDEHATRYGCVTLW